MSLNHTITLQLSYCDGDTGPNTHCHISKLCHFDPIKLLHNHTKIIQQSYRVTQSINETMSECYNLTKSQNHIGTLLLYDNLSTF